MRVCGPSQARFWCRSRNSKHDRDETEIFKSKDSRIAFLACLPMILRLNGTPSDLFNSTDRAQWYEVRGRGSAWHGAIILGSDYQASDPDHHCCRSHGHGSA
jgi:hypothetical protein